MLKRYWKQIASVIGAVAVLGTGFTFIDTWLGWPPYASASALESVQVQVAEASAANLLFQIQVLRARIDAKRAQGQDSSGDISRLSAACVAFEQQTNVRPLECRL